MPTLIHHHDYPIAPDRLDTYLQSGWRPAGQAVYTADFLRTDDDELYGCVQVRLPLKDFTFKKRHRKLLRQNGERFRHTITKAGIPDPELLELNARYMVANPDRSREDLSLHVTGEYGWQVLDTRIIRVYDGDKLVAFSYFDLGKRTAYTKAGIYDPEYTKFSLGIYTMVLEIQWVQQQGVSYYHPGYVVPRYPLFDYKLQFGDMEFRRVRTGQWLPYRPEAQEDNYLITERALLELRQYLPADRKDIQLMEYASFTARFHYQSAGFDLLDSVMFLSLGLADLFGSFFIMIYRLDTGEYQLLRVKDSHLRDMHGPPNASRPHRRYTIPLLVLEEVARTESVSEAAFAVSQLVTF